MEKLIKLLNKYSHTDFVKYEDGCFVEKYGGEGMWYSDVEVISKDFGFIKWLCDKDKIDLFKLPKEFENICGFGLPNRIVMILSIQDRPIEFLVNILK